MARKKALIDASIARAPIERWALLHHNNTVLFLWL
jgi:hypothetical protein